MNHSNDSNNSNRKSARFPRREELLLWLAATKDVKKLKKVSVPADPDTRGSKKAVPSAAEKTIILPRKGASGTDRRTAEKLRRGKISVDRQLDLHGLTQGRALDTLRKVLGSAYESGDRVVLVITGKGRRTGDAYHWLAPEPGVLRRKLPEWLRTHPLDKIVLDFAQAKQKHGGEGAFYVLLRRKR